jgi:hypothetical protein
MGHIELRAIEEPHARGTNCGSGVLIRAYKTSKSFTTSALLVRGQ